MGSDLAGWVEWKHTWQTAEPQWQPLVDTQVFITWQTHIFDRLVAAEDDMEYDNGLPEDVSSFVKSRVGGAAPTWIRLAQLHPHQELLQSDPNWKALYEFMHVAARRLVGNIYLPERQHLLTAEESWEWVRLILWFNYR